MLVYLGFLALVSIFLALDLGVFNKDPHKITAKESLRWTVLWVSISLLFSGFVYFAYNTAFLGIGDEIGLPATGQKAALTYLTGYVVELSLSMDNIFVIAVIFNYFKIPQKYQHRVLFWGIVGALVFRGIMIAAGSFLITQFEWIIYLFGAVLLWTAYKMLTADHEDIHPEENPIVLWLRKFLPVTTKLHEENFFLRENGKIVAMTPLFIALIVVETTDVMFAFDSIPAIFAITSDPFLVFTSNIFAILGLRSLYFVLASVLDRFGRVKYSLVAILIFVGLKMVLLHPLHIDVPEWLSLSIIVALLAGGVIWSMLEKRKEIEHDLEEMDEQSGEQTVEPPVPPRGF